MLSIGNICNKKNVCGECDMVGGIGGCSSSGGGGGKKAKHQKMNEVIREIRIELL